MSVPTFIKGHIGFTIDDTYVTFRDQNITLSGVFALSWRPLNEQNHFGRSVDITLSIPFPLMTIRVRGIIIREITQRTRLMGIRFELTPEQKARLAELIAKHGNVNRPYGRKYPRIPVSPEIETYPMRATITGDFSDVTSAQRPRHPIVFDIVDFSPSGALLSTENQLSLGLVPNKTMEAVLQPRGWFLTQIKLAGVICRSLDIFMPHSPNLIRQIGVRFSEIEEASRAPFLSLLKDILERLQSHRRS